MFLFVTRTRQRCAEYSCAAIGLGLRGAKAPGITCPPDTNATGYAHEAAKSSNPNWQRERLAAYVAMSTA